MSIFSRKNEAKDNLQPSGSVFAADTRNAGTARLQTARSIQLDRIEAAPQYRKHFDLAELNDLAKSMQEKGQLQPIRVRWDEAKEKYIVVVGERRFRAAKIAGFESIDAIVSGDATDGEIIASQIAENSERKDVRPSEYADGIKRLMDAEGLNIAQVARRIGHDRTKVSRHLQLLEMPGDLRERVDNGDISIVDAIKEHKQDSDTQQTPGKKRKSKGKKELRVSMPTGTVTIKLRRVATTELAIEAMQKAIEELKRAA